MPRRKFEQDSSAAKTDNGPQAAADSASSPAAFQPRAVFWVLVFALAALVAVAGTLLMLKLYDLDTGYSKLGPLERRLNLYSEQAFYFSFYEDLVIAPSFAQGVLGLLNETQSEYPDTINAIERFNIYPEVLTAALYRALGLNSDPFDLMVRVLMVLAGLQWAGFLVSSAYAAQSVLSGVLATVFAFVYYSTCTRLNYHLTLRENFATPMLWWQVFSVVYLLRTPRVTGLARAAFVILTALFMLCWQFAQFVLILQMASVFFAYLVGTVDRARTLCIFKLATLTTGLVIVATLGNTMLLTSLYLFVCIGIVLALSIDGHSDRRLFGRLRQGLCAILFMVLCKMVSGWLVEDDAHIFRILRSKWFNHEDFVTFLYLCGPTYRAMQLDELRNLTNAYLPQVFLAAIALAAAVMTFSAARGVKVDPALPFLFVQTALFVALALTVRRLVVIAAPQAILFASMLGGPLLYPSQELLARQPNGESKGRTKDDEDRETWQTSLGMIVAVILIAALLHTERTAVLVEDLKMAQPNVRVDRDTGNLIRFIQKSTSPEAVIAADSVVTSAVKLMARRRIIIHPHTENQAVRQRHHEFFQIYNQIPEKEVYEILSGLSADYVVISDGPCRLRCEEGQDMAYMANSSDTRGRPGRGRPDLPQFCLTARTATLKLFRRVYADGPFVVLRLRKVS